MYWRSRNLSALYVWLFGPFTPVNSRVTRGDTVQQAIEKMQGQLDAAGVGLDDTVTEESSNAVKSGGIWTWVKGLFTPKNPAETEADTLTDESVFQFWKGELKKITWANIKAALRTYFDTIYSTFSGSYNDLSHKPTIPSNAAQITVSEPVTPDFTPAVQGNNLQQVTNKVAGLQQGGADIAQIAAKLTETTYEQIPLGSFTINGAVGSGGYSSAQKHRLLYIKTGDTPNSSFYARTYRLSSGYFSGAAYNQIRWDRDMLLSFRGHVVSSANATENGQRWVVLGANETASPTNPNYKSIGIRSDFSTMYGIVHDGNALTEVDLGVNYSGGFLRDVTIKFYANEKVEWWVDGILCGNSTNIPIDIGNGGYNTFGISITNGSDSVSNVFMINDMKYWGAKL